MPGEKPELGSGEQRLWTAVIEGAIKEAVKNTSHHYFDGRSKEQAREFFQDRQCDVILKALDVDPEWFIGKLKARHPGIFETKEG